MTSKKTTSMSVTRALNELKLLDSRINRAISEGEFATVKKASADRVLNGRKSVEEFGKEAKSSYQSITDLIERRKQIKELIVASNATTKVVIGGKEYTVASAIERKDSISYDKSLLRKLKQVLSTNSSAVELANQKVEMEISSMNSAYMAKENAVSQAMITMNNEYRDSNKSVIVDPINLQETINKLTIEIEDFENEVDFALSESNALSSIEID